MAKSVNCFRIFIYILIMNVRHFTTFMLHFQQCYTELYENGPFSAVMSIRYPSGIYKKSPRNAVVRGDALTWLSQVTKLGELLMEEQFDRINRSIPVFGNDNFRDILAFRIGIVIIIPVKKRHDIGVLLQRA